MRISDMQQQLKAQRLEAVAEMHSLGATAMQIAGELGLSPSVVYTALYHQGLTPNKSRVTVTDETKQAVIDGYKAGVAVTMLMGKYHLSQPTFYGILSEAGVDLTRRRTSSVERNREVARDYLEGMKIGPLCAKHKINPQQLYVILGAEGVKTRRQAVAEDIKWQMQEDGNEV